MKIEGVGELTASEDIPEWLVTEKIDVPWWPGAKLRFVFVALEEDDRPDDFASTVSRFLALTPQDRELAGPYLLENYRQVCASADVRISINTAADIWQHVRLEEVFVRRGSEDGKVYVQLMAECEWEPEHGLQIVYREGCELRRVSQQDDQLGPAESA